MCLALSILGCSPNSQDIKVEDSIPPAEAEFDWFIQRLEHALESFSPSGSLGIRAKREMTYKLNLPSDTQPNYTAQVTIKSKTFFRSEYQPSEKDKKPTKPAFDSAAYDNLLQEDPLADPLSNPNQDFSELAAKQPVVPNSPTPMPKVEEVEVFDLAHIEGRWKLLTETDSERAKNWFEYALQTKLSTSN